MNSPQLLRPDAALPPPAERRRRWISREATTVQGVGGANDAERVCEGRDLQDKRNAVHVEAHESLLRVDPGADCAPAVRARKWL